jgi:hypothetical protein
LLKRTATSTHNMCKTNGTTNGYQSARSGVFQGGGAVGARKPAARRAAKKRVGPTGNRATRSATRSGIEWDLNRHPFSSPLSSTEIGRQQFCIKRGNTTLCSGVNEADSFDASIGRRHGQSCRRQRIDTNCRMKKKEKRCEDDKKPHIRRYLPMKRRQIALHARKRSAIA